MSAETTRPMVMDRTCHFANDFDEIMEASVTEDLACPYCTSYISLNYEQFKTHLLRVHFNFAYSFMLDGQRLWILPCRRKCITRACQGNRSHFHCPVCGVMYGRKPGLTHHIDRWNGECKPRDGSSEIIKNIKRIRNLRDKIYDEDSRKPSKYSFESMGVPSFIDQQLESSKINGMGTLYKNEHNDSAYTVVVENEVPPPNEEEISPSKIQKLSDEILQEHLQSQSQIFATERRTSQKSHMTSSSNSELEISAPYSVNDAILREDSATYFGKTVTSRMRGLNRKKQAKAMQRIMQILFEVEYSD